MDEPLHTTDGTPKEESKKYIRTFEGDAAIVQQGGTPDLVPFSDGPASAPNAPPTEPQTPSADIALQSTDEPYAPAVQIPAPKVKEAPKPRELPTVEVPKPDVAATPPAPPAPPPSPPPAPPVAVTADTLETYAGDFADHVADERASPATILAAEQDAGPVPSGPQRVVQPHHTGVYVVIGMLLLVLGGAGSYVAYTQYEVKKAPVALAPVVSAPIFVDEREIVSGTSTPLLAQITASVQKPIAAGAVRLLYETATSTVDMSVFNALMPPAPDILLRNVLATGSMAGVVNVNGTQTPFFVLAVSSYSDTFAGMLSWEKTMPRDLAALFPKNDVISVASSTVATTTLALKTAPLFVDQVIANHDARAYQDAGGPVLVYGYWNQSTLVIARDPATFTEILSRLSTSKSVQQ